MNISGPAAVAKPEMLFYAPGDLTVTATRLKSSGGWIRTAAATSLKMAQKQPGGLFLAARLATSTRAHQKNQRRNYAGSFVLPGILSLTLEDGSEQLRHRSAGRSPAVQGSAEQ
ncbi:hypothetical protein [Faecalibacterium sp. AF27-11BH]|uniref:hypothetical protein n=1 Tax=Faecalibacterium sp. AF27-11BH TaxID=2302956 RepID=UPI00105875BA|nr:hypothetical protein [Faecalibacterium sp. AF27-11BH]